MSDMPYSSVESTAVYHGIIKNTRIFDPIFAIANNSVLESNSFILEFIPNYFDDYKYL